MAAIAIRESGFKDGNEVDGAGVGIGKFQITVSPNSGVTAAQARNPFFASNYAAALLANNKETLASNFPEFTTDQLEQATAASYNFGVGNISGDPSRIDVGTAPGGLKGNYGSNVLDLRSCFR